MSHHCHPLRTFAFLAALAVGAPIAFAQDSGPSEEDLLAMVERVLDPDRQERERDQMVARLQEHDPERLGNALLDLGKQKDERNLSFLLGHALSLETRPLRLCAVQAMRDTDEAKTIALFLEKADDEDPKRACRAIDAAGLLAPLQKDLAPYDRFFEIAKGSRRLPGIEAARAVARSGNKRKLEKLLVDAILTAKDDQVRKHLVWALHDWHGERNTMKRLEKLEKQKGEPGRNAKEGVRILEDAQQEPFQWNPRGFDGFRAWWMKGRGKLRTNVKIGDTASKEKLEGFIENLGSIGAPWQHLALSVFSEVKFRGSSEDRIYDPAKRMWFVNAAELAQCETAWQGGYVITRNACIAFEAVLGEPTKGRRGWEPAYVEMHTYYLADGNHAPGNIEEFVKQFVDREGWR